MRAIAQGRADAIVDVVDFLGEHMNKYKDVKWQVVDKAIDTWYCGIGVKKGNASLQQWLNVALYTLHRADFVDETWEKWFEYVKYIVYNHNLISNLFSKIFYPLMIKHIEGKHGIYISLYSSFRIPSLSY